MAAAPTGVTCSRSSRTCLLSGRWLRLMLPSLRYRFLGRNKPEPDSFEASISALVVFLAGVPDLLEGFTGPLVLGGFSQGGTLSLGWALAKAKGLLDGAPPRLRPSMIVNLSGFLADHEWTSPDAGLLSEIRLFWGHGTRDSSIPFDLALEGRAALARTAVQLEAHDYDIGHWIDGQELQDVITWISASDGAEQA
jgi:phospholipase/carboxylesterase